MKSNPKMAKSCTEVNLEVIEAVKAKGFKSIRLNLLLTNGIGQATVEVIPGMEQGFDSLLLSLNDNREIRAHFEEPSVMAKYIIDQDFLVENLTSK